MIRIHSEKFQALKRTALCFVVLVLVLTFAPPVEVAAIGGPAHVNVISGLAALKDSSRIDAVQPDDSRNVTTTSLSAGPDPARADWPIRLVAVIHNPTDGVVTGTVTFAVNGVPFATAAVKQGAHWTEAQLRIDAEGQYSVTASYSGDSENQPSVGGLTETIILRNSTTRVSTSGSPSQVGQPVTFTASIIVNCCGVPNGEAVTFYDGKTVLGTVLTSGAQAQFTTSSLSAKTHTIKAVYAGDQTFKTSHGLVKQIVTP